MSSKRQGDLPEISAVDAELKTERKVKPSHSQADMDNEDASDDSDHATMRMKATKYDEAQTALAAALLENERLRAAASEPCVRCNYYSDWTVRVRTMSGQVHTIACPDGPKTLVAHVKQKLAQYDPKCHILQQVTLVLPSETSSSCSNSADPSVSTLADDRTLASCGLSKRDVIDLFLVDMNWSTECQEMIEFIKDGGADINFADPMRVDNDDLVLAMSWALVNAINPDLSSMRFEFDSVPAGGASKICAALCVLSCAAGPQLGPRISKLDFYDNRIGDLGANSCSELMRASAWLKELHLCGCGISSVGIVSIGSALHGFASYQLEILDLSDNEIGLDGAKSIGAALIVNTGLQQLNVSSSGIDIGGLKELVDALKVNGSLRKLHLDENEIDPAGAAFLADALRLNSSLRVLSMSCNNLGDDGSVLLSAALCVNLGLESLCLLQNKIGDHGAASLSTALRLNTGLKSVNLSQNQIGDPGAAALGSALALNSSLTCIELDHNRIGDAGAMAISEALCANSDLTRLTIYGNCVGLLGVEWIGKAQRENLRLEPISLHMKSARKE